MLEDNGEVITRGLVQRLMKDFINSAITSGDLVPVQTDKDKERLQAAAEIFEEVITKRDFPEFLTTYLNLDHTFLSYQKKYSE